MSKRRHDIKPPHWPLSILRIFIKKEYAEEIEGDMEEVFNDYIEIHSHKKASRLYTLEVIKLLRPILIKNLVQLQMVNPQPMFRNYFKISLRGLSKNPLTSFINVFGLAMAIGICIFSYAFARWTHSTDQFHENKNEVFLITCFAEREDTVQQYGRTPRPLGEMLRSDISQIKKVCRVEDRNVVMKYEDNVFHERVRFTDPEFLEMFTFPLKWGTSTSLTDLNSIILSEDMSIKYFGEENPIGQSILMKFATDHSKAFKVTGVAKEFPKALTIAFDFLINFENSGTAEPGYDFYDWKAEVDATLVQIDNPSSIKSVGLQMEKYRHFQNEAVTDDWAINSFGFEPLATLHERSDAIRDDISRSSKENLESIIYMGFVSLFMLLLACFNYINIAIVSAAKRLKEIGVRKSIGASRKTVIVQFLYENIVITSFALIIGVIIGMTFFIPGFEQLFSFDMDFTLNDAKLWVYLPLILLFVSFASGIYPSLYISKFQVVGILKGSVKFGNKNSLTKIFLGVQLILACIFITSAVMFTQNTDYMSHRSWGYNQSEVLYATVPDQLAYEELKTRMMNNSDVLSISGSANHLGKNNDVAILHFPDQEMEVDQLSVGANYFSTMELQIKEGRTFQDHEGSDRQSVIVNETLVKAMSQSSSDWENPVGQLFKINDIQYEVIGTVKDFHNYNFFASVRPIIFKVAEEEDFIFLSVKVAKGAELKTFKALQKNWAELFPETPFDGGYQEDVWGFYFEEIKIHGLVWRVFAFIAIALASLGLYGLVSLNVTGRTKEFSIRKVLGAGMKNLATNVSAQYLILFVTALAVASPVSYFLVKMLLESAYTYHMPVTISGVTIAVVILISVLLLTVSTQVRRVLKTNPVEGLKVE